jgi:hypothetical protein
MVALNRIREIKKSQLFIEFPFTWLNNLTHLKGRESFFFYLKRSFFFRRLCRHLDSAVREGRTRPHL